MKRRGLKRLLSGFLASVLMVTSVPPVTAQAVPSKDTVQEYDYAKMYSLEGKESGEYIAGYYKDTEEESKREMHYGEMTYLEFALSYNTPVKMELFIKGEAEPVGYVYGISYDGHVNKTEGTVPAYTAKPGMSQTKIRNEMAALCKIEPYRAMEECDGISLTGLTAAYRTIAEYYNYYGVEASEVMNAEEENEASETEDGISVNGGEPENEEMAPPEEPEAESERETLSADTSGNEYRLEQDETAEKALPADSSGKEDGLEERDARSEDVSENENNLEQEDTSGEAPPADVSGNEYSPDEGDTAKEDALLPDTESMGKEEYPEDFFIPYPEYGISMLADGPEELPDGILHNYLIWKGQFATSAESLPQYAPPGEYEIRITPTTPSLSKHTASLFFTIKGGDKDDGSVTEEDIKKILDREREFFKNENSGFPALVTLKSGDPVDLLSGALNWSYRDLLVEGKEPLDFTRTYVSSMRNRDISGLGNGWTHPYSYFAEMYRHDISVYMPWGGVINYQKVYGSGFRTAEGNEYALSETGDGGFVLSSDRGKTITFNAGGRATKVEEGNGVVTTLEYSGDRLSRVSTKTGSLRFAYDGDRLASVLDDSGGKVFFGYSGTDLATVENPDGDTITYTYDENHNLLTVTDMSGKRVLENTYDDFWRIATQKMPGRGLMTFSYGEGTSSYHEEGGKTQTITYDDNDRITSITDDAGTEYYAYDDRNRLVSAADKRGSVTAYTYVGDSVNIESITYPDGTAEYYTYNERMQYNHGQSGSSASWGQSDLYRNCLPYRHMMPFILIPRAICCFLDQPPINIFHRLTMSIMKSMMC